MRSKGLLTLVLVIAGALASGQVRRAPRKEPGFAKPEGNVRAIVVSLVRLK